MNEKETFQWVAPVIFGCGVSQRLGIELKAKGCTKVLLLHGKSVGASGVPARLIKNIEEAGLAAVPCDQVEPDPSDSMIDRGVTPYHSTTSSRLTTLPHPSFQRSTPPGLTTFTP